MNPISRFSPRANADRPDAPVWGGLDRFDDPAADIDEQPGIGDIAGAAGGWGARAAGVEDGLAARSGSPAAPGAAQDGVADGVEGSLGPALWTLASGHGDGFHRALRASALAPTATEAMDGVENAALSDVAHDPWRSEMGEAPDPSDWFSADVGLGHRADGLGLNAEVPWGAALEGAGFLQNDADSLSDDYPTVHPDDGVDEGSFAAGDAASTSA